MRWLALLLALTACAAPPPAPAAKAPATQGWVAALVAGDGSLPVFDDATEGMARLLLAAGTPATDIHRLSAAPDVLEQPRVQLASAGHVLEAVAGLHPMPGQACLVFVTSHGSHGEGVFLAPRRQFLTPAALDGALRAGCGDAPTVAIVSACYSGAFAQPPMTAANRVVLTASRADRPSFGCGAGNEFTHYDECLLSSLDQPPEHWSDVAAAVAACVARKEAAAHERPSMPQTAIGSAVTGLVPVGR